ncbi:LysE family translocator [Nitrogeniibacter aestuarii]|uniref:LysE family translocator n=1 Tax=Nitrogeniibacter aestuarii TaxID=2815343 RepID=UPI001D113683|nr:LysE family translocator [Nitrogeniibacter aestuarii]
MMAEHYIPFLLMVVLTVASPGPGVLMTIDNSLALGWRMSMSGVVGLALGAAIMAAASSAGVGLLIHSSAYLFTLLKSLGIGYLFYLAYRTWHREPRIILQVTAQHTHEALDPQENQRILLRGAMLQTSNPKSLGFFLSVLPQFVGEHDSLEAAAGPLLIAIATYCVALIAVHAVYAGVAAKARRWLARPGSAHAVSRASSVAFFLFGLTLLINTLT